jgi:hypothetical protein
MTAAGVRPSVERWLRATRTVLPDEAERAVAAIPAYQPGGSLGRLASHLKVAPDFVFTWTREKSSCAVCQQGQWCVIVDFGQLLPILEMVAVTYLRAPQEAASAIVSREIAERFRNAGLLDEAIVFGRWYHEHRHAVARIYREVKTVREHSGAVELFLAAHELAHVVFSADEEFGRQVRSSTVDVVSAFVTSQMGESVRPDDPVLRRVPANELARLRAAIQSNWLDAVRRDEALQEELGADDLARAIVLSSGLPGGHDLLATTLFLIQLTIFVLEQMARLLRGYAGDEYETPGADQALLRSEYASVDLAHLLAHMFKASMEDVRRQLGIASIRHKELFDTVISEFVIPCFRSLNPDPRVRRTVPPAPPRVIREKEAILDNLLSHAN